MSKAATTVHSFFLPRPKTSRPDVEAEAEACKFEVTLSALAAEEGSTKKKRPRLLQRRLDKSPHEATAHISKRLSFVKASVILEENQAENIQRQLLSIVTRTRDFPQSTIHRTSAQAPKSMLQQLQSRFTTATTKLSPTSQPKWNRCPWLHLPCNHTATAMAFDQDGVLLAVATTGNNTIHIWDWDTVVASDFQGRIDRKIDILPPILTMVVPHHPSDLQWNNDLLAVSFRATSHVHVYDMHLVSDRPANPSAACTVLQPPLHIVLKNQGPKCISFLTDSHFITAYPCGHVCLWKVSTLPTLIWTWNNSEPVLCFLPIASNLVLLGGTEGGFIVLDWKKTNRKAFASDKTPTVLSSWKTKVTLQKQYPTVASRDWGVQTMHLDCVGSTPSDAVLNAIGSCTLSWVTAGGWALSMDPSYSTTRIPTVHHAPPETQTRSFEGVLVSTTTKKFASPSAPVVTASSPDGCSGGLLVWHMVPTATHILPHHDKRVCQQRQVQIGAELQLACLMMRPGSNSCPATTLQHVNLKRPPRVLAIHRSNEWMLVATEASSKLLVYNARPPAPER